VPAAPIATVRWGILGAADIAVAKVIPAIQSSAHGRVVAIASRSGETAASVADEVGAEHAFGSYEELLDCADVDAVYIPLPNHLHTEWTIAAADAGKHILCEKPLALTSGDARRMVEHCERAGVVLMEAFMYRLHPLWTTALQAVEAGRIGRVGAIQTVFSYFNDDPSNIRNSVAAGGGALYDIGCYAVNLSRMVFGGEPTSVRSRVHRDDRFGTDVLTSALLDFGGRHATFVCSTQLEPSQRVEILGTAGRIVIDIPFNIPPHVPTRLHVIAGGDPPTSPHVDTIEIAAADPYGVQVDAFARAVRLGEPVPISPADAVANLEVLEAIFAESGGRQPHAGSVSVRPGVGHRK
jgi:predicted dehydrogenase